MTLRGSTSEFPLESVIGLLAGTSKTGELQVRSGGKVGALGFASGRLVAAVIESEGGEDALGAIFAISEADFEFTSWASPPEANLEAGDLVSILKRAAEARDRITGIRALIPSDRMRFRLSETAADQGTVTFTPERWRALLAVNGERDVTAVADQLRLGKMQTLTVLAALVKDGVIETIEPRGTPQPEAFSAPPPVAEPTPPPAPSREEAPTAAEPPTTTEWETRESSPAPAVEEPAPAVEEPAPAVEERIAEPHQRAPEPAPAAEEAAPEPAARQMETQPDLDAELAERFGSFSSEPAAPPPPSVAQVPPAVDDRLASLSGLFAPGPAANAPPPTTEKPQPDVIENWKTQAPPPRSAESWMTPPPAASEPVANAWAPTAPQEAPPTTDPWADTHTAPAAPQRDSTAAADEWAPPPPPPTVPSAPPEKKKGGLFGMFRREDQQAQPSPITRLGAAPIGTTSGILASLSNAMLMEYNGGGYGKGKIETRMSSLLMRVDEQADPIDRPLPVVDDFIDAAALEREGFAEQQAVPYLATLVRQIYEDAERAFGKDKAKRGYKAAQQQVFGGEATVLQSPDLANQLPKV